MSDSTKTAAVSGSCERCGCALGFRASATRAIRAMDDKRAKDEDEDVWYCCGACANSDRCVCGCKAEYAEPQASDNYVPGRRMFAARRADGLKTRPGGQAERRRAFPFADPKRGR